MFTFRDTEDLSGMTWCLRFGVEPFQEWKDRFTMYLWEGKNLTSFAKVKADEQKYVQDAYEDVEMPEVEEDKEERAEAEDEQDLRASETEENSESEHTSEDSDEIPTHSFTRGSRNEQLAVGYKDDLSFVTRGDMIGVFAHKDNRFKFRTAIDRVRGMDGKSFSPKKVSSDLSQVLTAGHAP